MPGLHPTPRPLASDEVQRLQISNVLHRDRMNTLRLTQLPKDDGRYHVEVSLEGEGLPRQTAAASFDFSLGAQEAEDLRWYLEDYLQHPHDPAPKIAARVERQIKEIGTTLFRLVFQSSDDARDLWATLRLGLSDTRVEVVTGVTEAAAVPWELLRDPTTDTPLALRARSFVRAHPQPAQRPPLPRADSDPMRILLVICRPGGDDDVPFRSVARRILKGLSGSASEVFQLDVLRPPTFERLGEALRRAKSEGHPYHVVHFDGHGVFLDLKQEFAALVNGGEAEGELPGALSDFDSRRYSPRSIYPREPREGRRGYLAFENPQGAQNMRLVDGPELGGLAGRGRRARARDERLPLGVPRIACLAGAGGRGGEPAREGARLRLARAGGDGRGRRGRRRDALQRLRGDGRTVRRRPLRGARRGPALRRGRHARAQAAQRPAAARDGLRPARRSRTGSCRSSTRPRRSRSFPAPRGGTGLQRQSHAGPTSVAARGSLDPQLPQTARRRLLRPRRDAARPSTAPSTRSASSCCTPTPAAARPPPPPSSRAGTR